MQYCVCQSNLPRQTRQQQSDDIAPSTSMQPDDPRESLQSSQLCLAAAGLQLTETWDTLIMALASVAASFGVKPAKTPPA